MANGEADPVALDASSPGFDAEAAVGALDDAGIMALAATFRALTQVNRETFQSNAHQGRPDVNVFVNSIASEVYSDISPGSKAPANFAFPRGALLVKEMLSNNGSSVLTVMYKKELGYDSDGNDWWYGRLSESGESTGASLIGKVALCAQCHLGSSQWDYAFGLPKENLAAR